MIHRDVRQDLQCARGKVVDGEAVAQRDHDGVTAAWRDGPHGRREAVLLEHAGLRTQAPEDACQRVDPAYGLCIGIPAGTFSKPVPGFSDPANPCVHG